MYIRVHFLQQIVWYLYLKSYDSYNHTELRICHMDVPTCL